MEMQSNSSLQNFLRHTPQGPYVSLYFSWLPTEALDAVRVRFKNMRKHVAEVMKETTPEIDFAPYEAALAPYAEDNDFWNGTDKNVGILTNGQETYVAYLNDPVKDTAMVTSLPQVLPLLQDATATTTFDVLALNADSIALFHNRGHVLTETPLGNDAPKTLKGTLGTEIRGGGLNSVPQGRDNVSYHGHNEKSAEQENDLHRFYTAVDRHVMTEYSNPDQTPLVLFGLAQNIAAFETVSKNNYLLKDAAIVLSPANLSLSEIDKQVEPAREKIRDGRASRVQAAIETGKDRGNYTEHVSDIAYAAISGRIDTLLIQADARIRARLVDGQLEDESPAAQHSNLLNTLADIVIGQGGHVEVLPESDLNVKTAAILRY